jgi:hypothetical protein
VPPTQTMAAKTWKRSAAKCIGPRASLAARGPDACRYRLRTCTTSYRAVAPVVPKRAFTA